MHRQRRVLERHLPRGITWWEAGTFFSLRKMLGQFIIFMNHSQRAHKSSQTKSILIKESVSRAAGFIVRSPNMMGTNSSAPSPPHKVCNYAWANGKQLLAINYEQQTLRNTPEPASLSQTLHSYMLMHITHKVIEVTESCRETALVKHMLLLLSFLLLLILIIGASELYQVKVRMKCWPTGELNRHARKV